MEIRVYKPQDKKYTAGLIIYEREMNSKENMLHVNHYYYNLFETDNRTQGSSHSISEDKSCYFRPEKEDETDCSIDEVEEIKKLIEQSEEVLKDAGIDEKELIEYVYWKYVPDDEKIDEE